MEASKQKDFQLTLLDGLSREYHTVWLVRMNHEIELYRTTGISAIMETVDKGLSTSNYDEAMDYYIDHFISESDRVSVREKVKYETVRSRVPETGIYSVTCKRIDSSGEEHFHQMCFAKATNDQSQYFRIILAFRDIADLKAALAKHGYSASIGFYSDPLDGIDMASFIKIAENKMYAAKRRHYSGRNDRRRKPRE